MPNRRARTLREFHKATQLAGIARKRLRDGPLRHLWKVRALGNRRRDGPWRAHQHRMQLAHQLPDGYVAARRDTPVGSLCVSADI